MSAQPLTKPELKSALQSTLDHLTNTANSLSDEQFNQVPFEGSWAAGQVIEHITKSVTGADKILETATEPIGRNPEEKIEELANTFLDFSTKMKSPKYIEPEVGEHHKEATIDDLQHHFKLMMHSIEKAEFEQVIKNTPFGDISKSEMLHFMLFHSQRHLHQLQKIADAVNAKV